MKSATPFVRKGPPKTFIHYVLQTLIGRDNKNPFFEMACQIIGEFQIYGLLLMYSFEVIDIENTNAIGIFAYSFGRVLCYGDLFNFDTSSSLNNVALILIMIYLAILLSLAGLVVANFLKQKPVPSYALRLWDNVALLHYTIAFLIIHQYFLGIVNNTKQSSFDLFGSSERKGFVILACIILPINLLFSLLFVRFLYEPLKTGGSRRTSPDVIAMVLKIVDVPLTLFITNLSAQKWIRASVMVVITIMRTKIFFTGAPFYDYHKFRACLRFASVATGLVMSNIAMAIIIEINTTMEPYSVIFIVFILTLFVLKIMELKLESMVKDYCSRSIQEIKNENDFFYKILAVEHVLEKGSKTSTFEQKSRGGYYEYLFYAVVQNHKEKCGKSRCGCKVIAKEGKTSTQFSPMEERELIREFKFNTIKSIYKSCLKTAGSGFVEVKIGYANLVSVKDDEPSASAIGLIHSLHLDQRSIEAKLIGMMVLDKVEERIADDEGKLINIKEVVDYHLLSQELRKAIESNVAKFIQFWDTYRLPDPSLKKLYTISTQINKEAADIGTKWDKIIKDFSKLSYQDYLLYGLYQSLIRSAPYSAQKTLEAYFKFSKISNIEKTQETEINRENVHEATNILICISMKKEKLGMVTFVTSNIEHTLLYNKKEVLDKNVSFIMPTFYQERHKKVLINHIVKGKTKKSSIFHANRAVFAKKKNENIAPCTLYVTLFPYIQDQLFYIGILKPIKTYDQFIIVLNDGTIDGFTEEIGRILDLNPEFNRRYHLKDISNELAQLHNSFLQFVRADPKSKSKTTVTKSSFLLGSNTLSKAFTTFNSNSASANYYYGEDSPLKKPTNTGQTKDFDVYKTLHKDFTTLSGDEIVKLYELFLTTGVTVYFNKHNEDGHLNSSKAPRKLGYNTTISEETMLESHVRIFKLQTTSADEFGGEDFVGTRKLATEKESFADRSLRSPGLPTSGKKESLAPELLMTQNDVSVAPDNSLRLEVDDDIQFRNPFSDENLNTYNYTAAADELLSPKTLLSPKDPLLPLLSPTESSIHLNRRNYVGLNSNLTQADSGQRIPTESVGNRTQTEGQTLLNVLGKVAAYTRFNSNPSKGKKSLTILKEEQQNSKEDEKSNEIRSFEQNMNNINNQEKTGLKDFLKENKIITVAQAGNDGGERNSVTSSVKTYKINSKLESAIYLTESYPSIRYLTLFILVFCLGSLGMVMESQVMIYSTTSRIQNNLQILQSSYNRIFYIVEINRRGRMLYLLQKGLASSVRHTPDYALTIINSTLLTSQNLTNYNFQLRSQVHMVDDSIRKQFYTQIAEADKWDMKKIIEANTFDICDELVNTGLELYQRYPSKPNPTSKSLLFIFNNTFNDLLVESQRVVPILREDNVLAMNEIRNTLIIVLAVALGITTVIFILALKIEMNFIKRKAHFHEIFLMIKDYEIEPHLFIASNFHGSLKENRGEEYFAEKVGNEKFILKAKMNDLKKNQSKSFKAKRANKRGINMQIFWNLVFTFVYLMLYIILFGASLIVFLSEEDNINNARLKIIDTKVSFFRYGLLYSSIYEYITENITTKILENPINDQWEEIYTLQTSANSRLMEGIDKGKPYNDEYEFLLTGDLCPVYFARRNCYVENSGVASKGIMTIDSYILKLLRGVKDHYDSSNKTVAAQTEALQLKDLISAETVYEAYSRKAYAVLDDVLSLQFHSQLTSFTSVSTVVAAISAAIFVLATLLIWFKVSKRMIEERSNYKNMMRVIPVNVIMGNRFLKNYLLTHSKKILESVKNRM